MIGLLNVLFSSLIITIHSKVSSPVTFKPGILPMRYKIPGFILASIFASVVGRAQLPSTLAPEERVLGLSKFWKEAAYNFAFFQNVPHLNWDSAYTAFVPKVLTANNDFEYYRQLQAFSALLQDGHTNVYLPQGIAAQRVRRSFGDIKLELKRFGQKAVVVNTSVPAARLIPTGSEITHVDGMPVTDYISIHVRPYLSQSTHHVREDMAVDYLLEGFLGDTLAIRFKRPDGTEKNLQLVRGINDNIAWQRNEVLKPFEFQMLPGGIAIFAVNRFDMPEVLDSVSKRVAALERAKGVIIDLRRNGGGSSEIAAGLLSYFTDADTLTGSRWRTRQHRAAHKAWGAFAMQDTADRSPEAEQARAYYLGKAWYEGGLMQFVNQVSPGERMGKMPLVVLQGHETASAAEDFLVMLSSLPGRAITIGQPSFGSTGQPVFFNLPGGGSARICAKQDTYPDGRPFVGVGIQPDIEVVPTVEDFIKGRDPVMEQAKNFLLKR